MRHLFKITLDTNSVAQIKNNKLHLPKILFDFLPDEKHLLRISLPEKSSNIYSLISSNNLLLNQDSKSFFESLTVNSILFGSLYFKNQSNESDYEIAFSKSEDFSDINITERPIVSKDLISTIDQVLLS